MSEQDGSAEAEESHGVSGATRGDSRMEEEPTAPDEANDAGAWAEETETGGQAAS